MKPRSRSLTGAAIAVFALPLFVGLTACLPTFPVPVGNPEKSTIDPEISGVWLMADRDDAAFYVFEPYDKRTWLLTTVGVSEDLESCRDETVVAAQQPAEQVPAAANPEVVAEVEVEQEEIDTYATSMANIAALGTDCFIVERGPILKAWRTRLGGEWFMTWEDKGVFDAERKFEPEEWAVFHIDKSVAGELRLGWINMDHEAWKKFDDMDEADITRRDVERIIRKHAGDADFYYDDDDDEDDLIFVRVRPEHYELIADFLDAGMVD
jgi:hypothetical protein